MKLLLTSSGFTNQSIVDALLRLTEKPCTELNLAFIPTAANFEAGDKAWLIDDLINCQKLGFKSIDIVDISAIDKDNWLPRLQATDVIIVGGGNTFYLMSQIEKSGLKELLPDMLKTKVYCGISAGSAIACPNLDFEGSTKLYDEEIPEGAKDEGFGWVDFLIRPHLNSEFCSKMNLDNLRKMSDKSPEVFYAIDDQTAVVINGDKLEVISEGQWKKFNQ